MHPTSFETPDASYVVIDVKKRLRVLHVFPDLSNLPTSAKTNLLDQVDAGDHCSLDSTGEDYWFMRWNRPIRPNFQRNSCSCSFRKSQIKSAVEPKDVKPIESMSGNAVLSAPVDSCLQESAYAKSGEGSLYNLAEKLSQDIVMEAVQKSFEIETNSSHEPLNKNENDRDNLSKCCDNVCVDDAKLPVRKSDVEFGGYVNPMFIASNDSLDLISNNETYNITCDNQCENGNFSTSQDMNVKDQQDHNANDQNSCVLEDLNAHNNRNINIQKQNTLSVTDSNANKKRHRKSCLAGSKAYLKKPVLLLIHGAGSNCEVWQNLISHLVRGGYECVAPDLLGHGLSSAPDSASCYTFHSFLQDLLFIFDRFVTEGRTAVILGHGYGCSLAAAIARYRPEQVIQLVLISGGGPTPLAPRTPPSVSPCLRACLEPLLMCGFKRDVVYSVCGKQMVPISPETSAVPRHIVEHIAQGHVWPEGDAAFHRRIVAPTLLVHGMRDQHITLVQQCEMERTIPRSFLEVIPDAGHWAMLETPSHLSHMILCFIDWWAPPNRTQ